MHTPVSLGVCTTTAILSHKCSHTYDRLVYEVDALEDREDRLAHGGDRFVHALELGRELQELGVVLVDDRHELYAE